MLTKSRPKGRPGPCHGGCACSRHAPWPRLSPEARAKASATRRRPLKVSISICPRCDEPFSHATSQKRVFCSTQCQYGPSKTKEQIAEYRRKWNAQLSADVRGAYGDECTCCGEDEPKFLLIDHIDGTGAARRRSGIDSGFHFHLWLRREGFPPGFQILCHNCNQAKGSHGQCPHKEG